MMRNSQASEAAPCSWVTLSNSEAPVHFLGFQVAILPLLILHPGVIRFAQELSESSELVVAKQVRERLHLFHLSAQQVGVDN